MCNFGVILDVELLGSLAVSKVSNFLPFPWCQLKYDQGIKPIK